MTEAIEPEVSLIQDAPQITEGVKPDFLPDDYWDAEKKTPIQDKVLNGYQQEKKRAEGLRVKLSKGEFEGKAPEDIKEYVLELDEKFKSVVPDNDPLLEFARQTAKERGMPKELFNSFVAPIIGKIHELQAALPQLSEEEQAAKDKADTEAYISGETAKLGPSGGRIVEAVGSFIKEMESDGTLSPELAKKAKDMAFDADAIRVLNALRMRNSKSAIPIDVPIDAKSSLYDLESKLAAAIVSGNEMEAAKYTAQINGKKYG